MVQVDSLPYYDTTNIDFKFLKAYSSNNTIILNQIRQNLQRAIDISKEEKDFDSSISLKNFKDLHADEMYRFEYGGAFCSYFTVCTILKNKDSIILSSIVYQHATDTSSCKVVEQGYNKIDSINWEKFQESIDRADFWGLKTDNLKHGLDGRTLTVYGFKKGTDSIEIPDRVNYISRWSSGNLPITDTYLLLTKFAKIRKGCLWSD